MARGSKNDLAPMVGVPQGPHIEEYLIPPQFDSDGVQVSSGIGRDGKEYPDPVPMSPPIGYTPPSDMLVMLENLFQRGRAVLEAAQVETEEEANDFNCEDDPLDELTQYERVFEPPVMPPAPPAAPVVPSMPGAAPVPQTVQPQAGGNSGIAPVAIAAPVGQPDK